jgi:RNA polymerase sigma factor (TIGR02999 family)
MSASPVTLILQKVADGDKGALDRLVPLVYRELRQLADAHLRRERSGHTLQPTALVHEAYMRLVEQDHPDYRSRAHFMGVAAHIMRQILTDHARARNAAKRGGGAPKFSLDEAMDAPLEARPAVITADEALKALEQADSLKARLIELRFFGGMTAEESAELLSLPVGKVRAELRVAQAWLQREIDGSTAAR